MAILCLFMCTHVVMSKDVLNLLLTCMSCSAQAAQLQPGHSETACAQAVACRRDLHHCLLYHYWTACHTTRARRVNLFRSRSLRSSSP